jgi:hypothetical protein
MGIGPGAWETRVGEIELLIPRKRQGNYFPSLLESRRRSEQAIVAVVLEAYVNGVSTRKVDRLVEQRGVEGMTKDRVSTMCPSLDEQVELISPAPLKVERVNQSDRTPHRRRRDLPYVPRGPRGPRLLRSMRKRHLRFLALGNH